MLMSITSRSAPSDTATATAHLLTAFAPAGARTDAASVVMRDSSPRVDREIDAHSGTQHDAVWHIEHSNPHGDSLHDLGEVAGRIVWREQAEAGAGRARNALHLACETYARQLHQ